MTLEMTTAVAEPALGVPPVAASSLGAGLSQTDVVLRGITAMITKGQLSAGSLLPAETDLAEALGVTRSPLREGVRALCIMGVLETRRGVGTYVTSLDSRLLLAPIQFTIDLQTPEHRHELHAVRRLLESEAAGRAALTITPEQLAAATAVLEGVRIYVFADPVTDYARIMEADVAFHRIVAEASENGPLAAMVDALTDRTFTARRPIGVHSMEQVRLAYELHTAILDALKEGDPDLARLLMNHHLLATKDYVHEDRAALDTVA